MKQTLLYATSNNAKFQEAEVILHQELKQSPFALKRIILPIHEIQGSAEEIALEKLKTAFAMGGGEPIIIDDDSLYIDGLNGLPGPYVKHFLEQLGVDGIWNVVSQLNRASCHASCMIGFMKSEHDGPHLFSGNLYGDICKPPMESANSRHSWNCIFKPRGYEITLAEMGLEEMSRISHRSIALAQLAHFLVLNR